MTMFTSTDPVQSISMSIADVSYINFSNVAIINVTGAQLTFVFDTQFYVYILFDNSTDAQSYAASLVGTIGLSPQVSFSRSKGAKKASATPKASS